MIKPLFTMVLMLFSLFSYADYASLKNINGKEFCVPFQDDLAFSYNYTFNVNHKYVSIDVLSLDNQKSDVYEFVGRQGSYGRLLFKAKTQHLKLGKYFYTTDNQGSNSVGFIGDLDELGNPLSYTKKIKMTYNISSSYKVWVHCY